MMHRLLQEMGKFIVHQESKQPAQRSRVWLSRDSYKILSEGKGSETVIGLALDMHMLDEENFAFKRQLNTDSLKKMDNLKLLCLNFVELTGSYESFSEDLRWLCWLGFRLRTVPSNLFMGNLIALDMSYSHLKEFEPPTDLQSLQILNLKDSHNLFKICHISRLPNLETLILWNCHRLVHVCETIGGLKSLSLLNMTGCKNLCKKSWNRDFIYSFARLKAFVFGEGSTQEPSFSLPHSLERLFLNGCNLEFTASFLSFDFQLSLQYLNLGDNLFEFLPCYAHLENLQVLDLSFCSKLKHLLRLPSTLTELYIYNCKSLERITFQSHRFTLQEFGYEGCINLSEVEGFIKLVPIAKLDEISMGHMKWLKKYQNLEVLLVGDDELMVGRNQHVQMLYEFDIMSTSLPDIKDPNLAPQYTSESPSLSFDIPLSPKNQSLKGLNVSVRYKMSGDSWVWFAKISTINGVNLIYNPKVFGRPGDGEVGIWLSYWPIGNKLNIGEEVNVSIVVNSGLEVLECGASLVYTDETSETNTGWAETLGGDLSAFQLSTGAYYLCRRDLYELMEVGRRTDGWFTTLVGGTIDHAEIQGWRKTGRPPKQLNQSSVELNTVRCIIHGPESGDIYKISEMSKSSSVDKPIEFKRSVVGETMKSGTSTSEIDDAATEVLGMDIDIPAASVINEIEEFESSSPKEKVDSYTSISVKSTTKKKTVLKVNIRNGNQEKKMFKSVRALAGVESVSFNKEDGKLTVVGDADSVTLVSCLRKIKILVELVSVGPASAYESNKEHETGVVPAYKSARCSVM